MTLPQYFPKKLVSPLWLLNNLHTKWQLQQVLRRQVHHGHKRLLRHQVRLRHWNFQIVSNLKQLYILPGPCLQETSRLPTLLPQTWPRQPRLHQGSLWTSSWNVEICPIFPIVLYQQRPFLLRQNLCRKSMMWKITWMSYQKFLLKKVHKKSI